MPKKVGYSQGTLCISVLSRGNCASHARTGLQSASRRQQSSDWLAGGFNSNDQGSGVCCAVATETNANTVLVYLHFLIWTGCIEHVPSSGKS